MAVTNSGMTLYQDMDTDTNWVGEDGISLEEFQQGIASQQWIVAKNGNETATLTLSADMSGAKYLMIPMISTISPFYTSITATLGDGTTTEVFTLADQLGGLLHRAVAGQWEFNNHCLQFIGTITLLDFASIAINVDNSSSGNIRSVLNHYIDAIYFGVGRIIAGSTALDKLFKESNDLNISNDVFDGCTLEFSGGIDAQTDIEINTTLGNSYGEVLTFREVANTDNIYTLLISGTADFQDTLISSATPNVTVHLDASSASSFQKLGGSLVGAGTTILGASQVINGVVFTSRTSIAHNGSIFESNTINKSGSITVLSTGTFAKNNINESTSPVLVSILDDLDDNGFKSSGDGNAVELTGVAPTQEWNNTLVGYDAGTAGNGVEVTGGSITGKEAIHITATSGTFTINVADGATTPSVSSAGAIVNVLTGQATLTIVCKDQITKTAIQGVAVTIDAGDAGDFPYNDSVTITQSGGTATVLHTAHGRTTGDKIKIDGANENNYNRIKTITVTGADEYTYSIDSGTASPATGTITATLVLIDGLTDVAGSISDTRSYNLNQEITGFVAKGTSSPLYKRTPVSDTVDKTNGLVKTILMISDE